MATLKKNGVALTATDKSDIIAGLGLSSVVTIDPETGVAGLNPDLVVDVGVVAEQVGIATTKAGEASASAATASAASDSAYVNANVYASTAVGLAAVADGVQFQVVSADRLSIQRYRRDSASVATAVGVAYPSASLLPSIPANPDGVVPINLDVDGRILFGYNLRTEKVFIPTVTEVTEMAATLLPQLADGGPPDGFGIVPYISDADGRTLIGYDVRSKSMYLPAYSPDVGTYDVLFPNDPRLLVSDYDGISEQSATRLRFVRSIVDGQTYEHCSPGARVGIVTDSLTVKFVVNYTTLLTGSKNSIGGVLVDGVLSRTFTSTGSPSTVEVDVAFDTAGRRKVELVWPYRDSLDLVEIRVDRGVGVGAASQKSRKIIVSGDSVTHGSSASNVNESWPQKLAALKSAHVVNLGYGGRSANADDGTLAGNLAGTEAIYMIGINNYNAQTALATFKATLKSYVANFRACPGMSSVPLYLISPTYITSTTGAISIQSYRDQVADAVSELSADTNLHYIDGLSIMTNSTDRLGDGTTHPNDLGSTEIAAALNSAIA